MFEGIKNAFARVWGRKTFITIAILVLGTLVDIFSKAGLSANLMSLMGLLAGSFTIGNGLENHAAAKTAVAQSTESIPQNLEVLSGQIAMANQSLTTVMETLSYIIKTAGLDNPQGYIEKVAAVSNPAAVKRAAADKVLKGE